LRKNKAPGERVKGEGVASATTHGGGRKGLGSRLTVVFNVLNVEKEPKTSEHRALTPTRKRDILGKGDHYSGKKTAVMEKKEPTSLGSTKRPRIRGDARIPTGIKELESGGGDKGMWGGRSRIPRT